MQAVHEALSGDLSGHETDGSTCPCVPAVEAVKDLYGTRWVYIHNPIAREAK